MTSLIYKCPLGHDLEKIDNRDTIMHGICGDIYNCDKCVTQWVIGLSFSENRLRACKFSSENVIRKIDNAWRIEYIPELDGKHLTNNGVKNP